jgi:hypothetical protein
MKSRKKIKVKVPQTTASELVVLFCYQYEKLPADVAYRDDGPSDKHEKVVVTYCQDRDAEMACLFSNKNSAPILS